MVNLSTGEKLLVIAGGFGVVIVAFLMVVCLVTPLCPLHRILPERAQLRFTPLAKKKKKKLSKHEEMNGHTEMTQLKQQGITYINYGNDLHLNTEVVQTQNETSLNFKQITQQRRPTALSTRESTVDSTYSSMTPTGSRPSTPISTRSDPLDVSSIDSNSVRSADSSPLYGSVTISLQLSTTEDPATVRLLIGVQEAQDLPPRDSIACGDPFFKIQVVKEMRAFRRAKSKGDIVAEFETSIQKRTRHPIYNQIFAKELQKSDIKDCVVRIAAFDKDKYANPTAFGETAVTLKNLNLSIVGQPILFSLELSEPKQHYGEIQFGLMYLPTAERLAFSSFRVCNLRPENLRGDPDSTKIYIRIISLHNGKMVTKKKTGCAKLTPVPYFDESIAFDVPTEQLQNLSFIVVVVAVPKDSGNDNETPTDTSQERCIGKISVGPKSHSTGLQHWELSLQRPREQVVLWHVLR